MKSATELQQLSAFVDGELGLAQQLDVETRLTDDAALRADAQSLQRLRTALRDHAEYHVAPASLRSRISALGGEHAMAAPRVAQAAWRRWLAWQPIGLALGLAGLLAWGITLGLQSHGHDERLMQEAIASHVRATLGQRLVDVASSDRHTVKPWLSSKLDFSPPVPELQLPGVVFLGGRVDYLDGHPVAALVYKQREHVIDAFVWPTQEADSSARTSSTRGFNTRHWSRAGMSHWVVSDLNPEELAALALPLERAGGSR